MLKILPVIYSDMPITRLFAGVPGNLSKFKAPASYCKYAYKYASVFVV